MFRDEIVFKTFCFNLLLVEFRILDLHNLQKKDVQLTATYLLKFL